MEMARNMIKYNKQKARKSGWNPPSSPKRHKKEANTSLIWQYPVSSYNVSNVATTEKHNKAILDELKKSRPSKEWRASGGIAWQCCTSHDIAVNHHTTTGTAKKIHCWHSCTTKINEIDSQWSSLLLLDSEFDLQHSDKVSQGLSLQPWRSLCLTAVKNTIIFLR